MRILKRDCNTLLWLLPTKCTDEVQPVDAGYGRLFGVNVGKELDVFLLEGDNVERWESNKLTASDRRILLTQWIGRAAKKIDSDMRYRRHLFKKTGLAMTADGTDDDLINLEGVPKGTYSFMDVSTTPEPLEDVVGSSPAPADEEYPPGSSDEDESDDDFQDADSRGERRREDADKIAILDIDDDLADDEVPMPYRAPDGYTLWNKPPAALTAALAKQRIMLRLGVGWVNGVITRQAQARTHHLYDFRVFLDNDGSTRSMRLPLDQYSADFDTELGSWALLSLREDLIESSDDESEEEFEERDSEEEAGAGSGAGSDSEEESTAGGTGGNGVVESDSEEDEESEESGVGGGASSTRGYVNGKTRKRKRSVRLQDH